jgi:hypothetical protein
MIYWAEATDMIELKHLRLHQILKKVISHIFYSFAIKIPMFPTHIGYQRHMWKHRQSVAFFSRGFAKIG